MANYTTLKTAIQEAIKQNGNNEITGALLQAQLLSTINSLGSGYQFVGIATPTTNPGTPDPNVFYIAATEGTYVNFRGIVIQSGEIAVLTYNGTWTKRNVVDISSESVGNGTRVINVNPGSGHSSALDFIPVKIKTGEKFYVSADMISGSLSGVAVFVRYVGASSNTHIGGVTPGAGYTMFTAANNIEYVGFYWEGPQVTVAGQVSINVLSGISSEFYQSRIENETEFETLRALSSLVAVDDYAASFKNVVLNKAAKTVTIKAAGIRLRYQGKMFALVGSEDFVMSYDEATAPSGAWLLSLNAVKNAVNGENITITSNVIFFADTTKAIYRNNIVLFSTYYGDFIPTGLLGEILLQRQIDAGTSIEQTMREYAFNSVYNEVDITTKAKEYSALINNSGVTEQFIFMTDPHLLGASNVFDESQFKTYIGLLQKYYNMLPVDWMICGGDWLNNRDTQVNACWKLGYMDATMRKLFKHYYPLLGNHDTNYQGVVSESDSSRGDLTHETLVNLMFRANKNTYYEWLGNNTRFFVFDTQLDWESAMNDFKWAQISWFAQKLLTNQNAHIIILQHIYYTVETTINPMAENIQAICGAFNRRTSVTLNGITYNFSGVTGKIHCIIAGHSHTDVIDTAGNVPVWLTTNMQDGNTPTFDLMLADYTAGKLKSVRVGTGSNREMTLA